MLRFRDASETHIHYKNDFLIWILLDAYVSAQNSSKMKPFLLASFYFFFYTVSAQTNQPSLNAAAITQKMYYGSILDHYDLGNRQYVSYVSHHAGVITTENAMKWENVEWNEGNFTLTNGANVVSWANENGKKMRGHCLVCMLHSHEDDILIRLLKVWHVNLPSWVQSISDKARLQAVLETHIDTVVTFHKGKIWHWDVVNEVFNDDGTLRKTVFYNVTGEDYLSTAFHAARKADPDAKLFVYVWTQLHGSGIILQPTDNKTQKRVRNRFS